MFCYLGGYKNFDNAFAYSETEPGKICLAFYSGIYSYAGWNYLNFMTEELKDPFRNLPYAIYLSLPVVTFLYILANVAYLAVLTPTEMMASNAIAVVRIFWDTYVIFWYIMSDRNSDKMKILGGFWEVWSNCTWFISKREIRKWF